MIDLVLPEARFGFAGALMQMHHDRKQVFVDRFGWRLPARGSWLEVDEFDNDFAVYLLARSDDGRHQGSVRLLPSTQPHMLQTLFANLCRDGAPIGEDVWEISRLVTNPTDAQGTTMLRVHRMLALALLEFATGNGITRYTLVAEASRVPALLSVGWSVVPLGLPTLCEGEQLQALQIDVEPGSLMAMRRRLRIEKPVLRIVQPKRQAA
ncbi:acyl-homoserine-lactone synthase [Sphingosinicella rhizophila]|uniref:Acyl-homoserine-lactone synthase n=1 Tax=Sphingosinicella rhizophila TaxID=3050082 RepID=A0ABU3Q6D5_9SPHN|nr:acyl-homoserine-lactone synthase [Sphingosinicella sp. GR2756]MDT9598966.1 acyl-homoserine-lactone synthase [Sphingosinicella sp. GR2756]